MISASDKDFNEIWLASHAIAGLLKLNKKKASEQFDCLFLKALLVGLCSSKKIKEVATIDNGILELTKGKIISFQMKNFFLIVV